jgi:hypothetical protein
MNHAAVLELARETAGQLGIRVEDPALVLRNMKRKIGITTILWNETFTIWVDRHYIAYSDSLKPGVVYVYADAEHVEEEFRSVIGLIKNEKSPYSLKTLESIKEQLKLAAAGMRKSEAGFYVFESAVS